MNELNISPEVALNTVRYIKKKEKNPKSHEFYEVINSYGEIVKTTYGNLEYISRQYQHDYELQVISHKKNELNNLKTEIKGIYKKAELIKNYIEETLENISGDLIRFNEIIEK